MPHLAAADEPSAAAVPEQVSKAAATKNAVIIRRKDVILGLIQARKRTREDPYKYPV